MLEFYIARIAAETAHLEHLKALLPHDPKWEVLSDPKNN
jgi:hypothetical protein